jgi:hypothetical protein
VPPPPLAVPEPPVAAVVPPPPLAAPEPPVAAVVPPPPLAAPEALVPPPPVEFDVTGLAWDPRIHTGTRTRNADGRWRQRRGVEDPAFVAAVETELRERYPAPPESAAPPVPASAAPPESAAPPVPASASAVTFADLLSRLASLVEAGKVSREEIEASVTSLGAPTLLAIAGMPELIPQACAALDALAARP